MPDCINKGKYVSMVEGLASASGIQSTPTVKINGQEFDVSNSTPDDLVAQVKSIVGDVPGLMPKPPAPTPTAPPGAP